MAVDQDQLLQVMETGDGKVRRHHRLSTLHAGNPETHVRSLEGKRTQVSMSIGETPLIDLEQIGFTDAEPSAHKVSRKYK